MTGTPGGKKLRALLADWREKGVPPDTLAASYDSGKMRLPVAVYPGLYVQDASGDWTVKKIPRGVAQIDGRCLETKCEVPQ